MRQRRYIVWSGTLLHLVMSCSAQWFYKRTAKVLIRLRGRAGWSGPSLFACARKVVFAWRGPHINHNVIKRTFGHVCPAKIQVSLRIRAVWSEYSLSAFWIGKDTTFLHADNRVSDQTVLRLRWAHMSEGTLSHIAGCMLSHIKRLLHKNGGEDPDRTAHLRSPIRAFATRLQICRILTSYSLRAKFEDLSSLHGSAGWSGPTFREASAICCCIGF